MRDKKIFIFYYLACEFFNNPLPTKPARPNRPTAISRQQRQKNLSRWGKEEM